MAADVEICNMALAHLGADALISSLNPPDGTAEANYCRTFYPHVRRMVLAAGSFDFTLRRAALSGVTNPSRAWLFAYALPADCLSPLRVLPGAALDATHPASYRLGLCAADPVLEELFRERGSSEFEVENQTLLTNEAAAVLKYKADVTDQTGLFPPALVLAMSMLLAGYLAGPIIKGKEGRAAGAVWLKAGRDALDAACAVEGSNRSERAEHVSAFARARS